MDKYDLRLLLVLILEFSSIMATIILWHISQNKGSTKWYVLLGVGFCMLTTTVFFIPGYILIAIFFFAGYVLLLIVLTLLPGIKRWIELKIKRKFPVTCLFLPAILCSIICFFLHDFLYDFFGSKSSEWNRLFVFWALLYAFPRSIILSTLANFWLAYLPRMNYFILLIIGFFAPVVVNIIIFMIVIP